MQRGPWWGPAPWPGRMQPLAARELSRAPAPAPAGPGLRSRSRRPAPERHDFQAAFRLDPLQVRGRRSVPPPSLQLGGAAHRLSKLRAWGRVEGTRPGAGWKHRAWAPIPSPCSPTHGVWVGGSGSSHLNFGGPGGLTPLALLYLSTVGFAGRGQCSRPAWALKLGLAAPCGRLGRERALLCAPS